MPAKFLNWIIVVSVIGISGIFVRDRLTKPKQVVNITIPTPTTGNIEPTKDPEVLCNGRYFTFKKGTQWKYRVITKTSGQTAKPVIKNDVFTSKIIEASPSSILIESQFVGEKEKVQNKITCRQSGLYGFPFPVFHELKNTLPIESITNFDSILLLPTDEKLKKGGEWKSNLGTLQTNLASKVEEENAGSLSIRSRLESSFSPLKSFMKNTENILKYSVAPEKGPTDVTLNVDIGGIQGIEITLKLLEFRKNN